jgi:tetratricopeptide (TPR) repeat protein
MAAIVDPSWAERGIEFAKSSEDARYWLGPIWNNLGWSRFDAGDAAGALDAFEHALSVQDAPRERAIARYAIARALRELGRVGEAIEELEVALAQSPGPHPIIEEELASMRAEFADSP